MDNAAAINLIKSTLGAPVLRKLAEEELWRKGDLSHLVMPGAQAQAYRAVREYEATHPNDPGPLVLLMHRGAMKSWLLVLLALERCLRIPNHVARIGSPSTRQTEEITEPALRFFLSQCPKGLTPHKREYTYEFRNPAWKDPNAVSKVCLFGCREQAEAQRGLRASFIALDEVRDVPDSDYVISSVLGPQYVRQPNPLMILSSTSPSTVAHPYWTYVDEAEKENRLIYIPVTKNTDFRPEDEATLLKLCKTRESTAWKREALCLKVADESLLAIPSFSRNKAEIVQEVERPRYFYPFLFADTGFKDYCACLYGYLHYPQQLLVIEDEILENGKGHVELARLFKAKEEQWFTPTPRDPKGHHYHEIRRYADDTLMGLADFAAEGIPFSPVKTGKKYDRWVGLAAVESLCFEKRLRIHPRCKHTIHQLENAVRNRKQSDIVRELFKGEKLDPDSPVMGHADSLFAIAYGLSKIDGFWTLSPFPPTDYGPNHFHVPQKGSKDKIQLDSLTGVTFGNINIQGL